jgi:hypothetical protein
LDIAVASSLAMRLRLSLLVAIALFACGGCGGKKQEEKVATGSGNGVGSSLAPVASNVALFVGDTASGSADEARVKDWPRLDSLLPEDARRLGKWAAIRITTTSGKMVDLEHPFEADRDKLPALFPSEGGGVSFGMFDPVELGKRGKPMLREDKIQRVAVILDDSSGRGGNDQGGEVLDPAKVTLKITKPSGSIELAGEKLLTIEREPMPGGGGDAKGWKLETILAAADVKTYKKVTLVDAGGTSIPLEKNEINAESVPFIKLNRKGALRFRLYKKQGDGWQASGDLASLAEIRVE